MRGIVLFAHGARDPEWARPFEAIRDRVQGLRPGTPMSLAYLEIMTPSLEGAIDTLAARGCTAITVFPLFMAQGGHLKQDVPRLIEAAKQKRAGLAINLETALGDVPEMRDAIAQWIAGKN
jgi:sirohydrochlorin cobaltochelatase